jgi:phosphomannomutase
MLLAQAAAEGADIAVAHDPDADRCAAGVFDPAISAWRLLTGDELGSLLAWWTIERTSRFDLPAPEGVMACSIVSSTLLLRLAEAAGLDARQTLTGFKWIGRVPGLAFGYEEALGYCVAPDIAADKDGITAGLRVVEMAASLKAEGRTLLDALEAIYTKHGLHATTQLSVRMSDPSAIRDAVQHLREQPPTEIAGRAITGVDDMALGIDGLPPTEGIRLRLADGHVIVRPSGTEPKLKCYLEYITPWTPTAHLWAAQVLEATKADLRIALGL